MVRQRVERKLAAILVADVAGYSRLMELDEEETHRRLSLLQREVIRAHIGQHHGKIIKNTGDGALVEFASVVDAVHCAVEIQRRMSERNANVSDDRRIEFRIGINLGDVIVEPNDIYGDGVNVAARLEGLADPGGLCISHTTYDQVRDKVPYPFVDRGEHAVKNISRPVRVYALSAGVVASLPSLGSTAEASRSSRYRISRALLAACVAGIVLVAGGLWFGIKSARAPHSAADTSRFSIVVLPFANLSGNSAQDYLADAITEGLTTVLSRAKGAFVIARSTAFTYKGKAIDIKQVGRELGVRYALEGSAQYSAGKVRVNAQLIDTDTGAHIWADQFDADRPDLLEMQDDIVIRLSRALSIQLIDFDLARAMRTRPGNLEAQDLAMQCLSNLNRSQDIEAMGPCRRALQLDGGNALALSLTAIATIYPVITAQSDNPKEAIRLADELASRALAADPNVSGAHVAKAWVLLAQVRHEEAIVEAEKSLALNPSAIEGYMALGIANNFLARPDRALEMAEKATRLSPRDPFLSGFSAIRSEAFFIQRQDNNAIEAARRSLVLAPYPDPYTTLILIAASALSGQQAQAGDALKAYLADGRARSKTIAQFQTQQLALANNAGWVTYNERFVEGLRKAGFPE
ncbi:adenylate/guanylate cyclase domain-containing protein [Bradyrhizobium sp. AUGA SZCCT0283]|uniref:adenylate/guanylate cyclase domain-containing protein n=1 Tax=Bradyrhizobium sp. AUGA SZCCT0283 TaxID=2807671 RepID=UPI001BAD3A1D|nr:adenylate/guanylate cyclase domain-containing protein [Bradyrhizobium sp. AUGA SZCCT0283]MBR1280184.1 guanylate cyclase [Bradyrhizobium sp. AUGA SZCCT0283]